jgi:hypothetical protein
MMKMIVILFLCNIIGMNLIDAQQCYVCDQSGCEHPGQADIKSCSEQESGGQSGQNFVSKALGKSETDVYSQIGTELSGYVTTLNLNKTVVTWASLTQWVNIL